MQMISPRLSVRAIGERPVSMPRFASALHPAGRSLWRTRARDRHALSRSRYGTAGERSVVAGEVAMEFAYPLRRDLADRAIVSQQAVDLAFDIGGLGVDGACQAAAFEFDRLRD